MRMRSSQVPNGASDALDAAMRRGLVAALGFAHLCFNCYSLPFTAEAAFQTLRWLGPGLATISLTFLAVGFCRRLNAWLLLALIAVSAVLSAPPRIDPTWILAQLAVAPPLLLVDWQARVDRWSVDHWRQLGRADLESLNRALRGPIPAALGQGLRVVWWMAAVALTASGALRLSIAATGVDGAAAATSLGIGLALFIPTGVLVLRSRRDDRLTVLYDEPCHFCARTLQCLRALDPGAVWTMRSEHDAANEAVALNDLDLDQAMFVLDHDRAHRGYHGFLRMLAAYGSNAPLVGVGRLPWISAIGERAYAEVAAHRSTWFTCAPNEEGLPQKEEPQG